MSIIVQAWVYADSEARGSDRLVLLAIADEADDDGTNSFPEQRRIAHKARLSLSTARRAIDSLEAAGEILVKRPEKTGRGHHNEYVVLMGRDADEVAATLGWKRLNRAAVAVLDGLAEGGQSDHLSGQDDTSPDDVERATQAGANGDEKRAETRQNAPPKDGAYPQTPGPEKKERARFPEFDALVEAFGEPGTRQEAAFYARTARSLRDEGKSPSEISDRGKRARARHENCTVNVLLTRWSNFAPPRGRAPGSTWDDVAARDAEARA